MPPASCFHKSAALTSLAPRQTSLQRLLNRPMLRWCCWFAGCDHQSNSYSYSYINNTQNHIQEPNHSRAHCG